MVCSNIFSNKLVGTRGLRDVGAPTQDQRQVKTAIRKSSDWGDFLKTLEQMYAVYERDFGIRTEIVDLPALSNSQHLPVSVRLWRR